VSRRCIRLLAILGGALVATAPAAAEVHVKPSFTVVDIKGGDDDDRISIRCRRDRLVVNGERAAAGRVHCSAVERLRVFGLRGDDRITYTAPRQGPAGAPFFFIGEGTLPDFSLGRGDDRLVLRNTSANALGGPGDDVMKVGPGFLTSLVAGPGRDKVFGGSGLDLILGGRGADRLEGRGFVDILLGSGGKDLVLGGAEADAIIGATGHDQLFGLAGPDPMMGGAGRDDLYGGPGADRLFGGAGRDRLFGGPGPDEEVQTGLKGTPFGVLDEVFGIVIEEAGAEVAAAAQRTAVRLLR
jgi:Ca2+-binding RTX toxin-like protein